MREKINKARKNKKGFSLVELIVVIAIMAVLVAILAPQFIKYVEKSRVSADKQNAQEVITAIQTYYSNGDNTLANTSTVTLKFKAAAAYDNSDALKAALTDAGITAPQLKSQTYKNGIVITATLGTDGTVTVTSDPAL